MTQLPLNNTTTMCMQRHSFSSLVSGTPLLSYNSQILPKYNDIESFSFVECGQINVGSHLVHLQGTLYHMRLGQMLVCLTVMSKEEKGLSNH